VPDRSDPTPNAPLSPTRDRAARRAVTAVFLANGLAVASFVSRIPEVQVALGLGAATLGLVLTGISFGVLSGLTAAGRLIPRTGSRTLILSGALVVVVALPTTGLAPNGLALALALFATGFGGATMDVGMNAHGVGVERGYGRSIMVGLHAAWSVGTLLGALGGLAATTTDTSVPLHLAAVATLIALLTGASARWLRVADRAAVGTPPRFAVPRGPLLPLALIALAAALGESTAGNWSGVHLRDTVGVVGSPVTWGYVAYTAAMVGARVVGDRLTRHLGVQRMVTGGGLLAGAGFLLVATVPALPAALVGFALVGCGLGSTVPLVFGQAGRVARTPGEGVAAVASVGYLAFLIGPAVVGGIAGSVGLSFAFGLTAAVIVVLTRRTLPTG
jgi:MFS family permease